jgi:hypothetical protein
MVLDLQTRWERKILLRPAVQLAAGVSAHSLLYALPGLEGWAARSQVSRPPVVEFEFVRPVESEPQMVVGREAQSEVEIERREGKLPPELSGESQLHVELEL